MKNLNLPLIRIAMIFGIVVGLFGLSTLALAAGDDPPTPDPPPIPITQIFVVDEEFSLVPYSDLVITSFRAPQPGYQAGTQWNVEVEVRNVGSESVGPFEIHGYIGRYLEGDTTLSWLPYHFYFGAITSLDPGQSELVDSPFYDFPDELSDSLPTTYFSWIDGFPDRGVFYLSAKVDATNQINERDENNNIAIDTMIYPSVPEGEQYDFEQDSDGDGFYDPIDCYEDDPQAYPGAEEVYQDGIDQDCQGGDLIITVPGHVPAVWPTDHDNDGDGYSEDEGDCNDGNPNIYPGADEFPNNFPNTLDDNCNYLVDEIVEPGHEPQDLDGDGYISNDCDPFNSAVNAGQNELYDGIDNDCDGIIDEGFVTPDWVISDFTLERSVDYCEVCGLWATFQVISLEGDLGQYAANMLSRNHVHIKDLAGREYGTIPHLGDHLEFIPYSQFPSQAYAESMACDPNGLIATMTGGLLGEQMTSNNIAYNNLEGRTRDADIVFRDIDLRYPAPPRRETEQPGIDDALRIIVNGDIWGTCPPPAMFEDYLAQVKIFLENEEVYSDEAISDETFDYIGQYLQVDPPGQYFYDFGYRFETRPRNGDQIRVEILLNSDERYGEDPSNNLCVIDLIYNRHSPPIENYFVPWNSIRVNDTFEFVSAIGCEAGTSSPYQSNTSSPYQPYPYSASPVSPASSGEALSGRPHFPWGYAILVIFVLAFSIVGGGMGLRIAVRRSVPLLGVGLFTSIGVLIGISIAGIVLMGIGTLKPLQFGALKPVENIPPKPPTVDDLIGIVPSSDDFSMKSCDELLSSSVEVSRDSTNEIEDIIIQIHPYDEESLPIDNYLRISVWDNKENSTVFTTRDTSLSLGSLGLTPEQLNPFLWQIEAGSFAGVNSDKYLIACNPTIHAFDPDEVIEEEVISVVETPETPTPTATTPPKAVPTKARPTATTPPKAVDTTGPKVSGASASPNPALTTSPVTISAAISDNSGVARARVYIKTGKGGYQSMGKMKSGAANNYFLNIGALTPAGTYTFRILAEDNLGNVNCSTGNLDACPGGSFVVNIP